MKRHVLSTKEPVMEVKKEKNKEEETVTKKRLKTFHEEKSIASNNVAVQPWGPPWTIEKLHKLVSDKERLIKWCILKQLLPSIKLCSEGHVMIFDPNSSAGVYRCQKKHITKKPEKISRIIGTWFHNAKISMERALLLTFCFALELTYKDTAMQSTFTKHTSSETVCDWFCYCRELVAKHMDETILHKFKIGGPATIVEVDMYIIFQSRNETEDNALYLFGLLERMTKELRILFSQHKKMAHVIRACVLEGSIIIADDIAELIDLKQAGYQVYQSENCSTTPLKDTITELTDSQSIESQVCLSTNCAMNSSLSTLHTKELKRNWPELRKAIGFLHRENGFDRLLSVRILEFLWRRQLKLERKDAFEELLLIIQQRFPV